MPDRTLVVDIETHTPGPKPDFRVDTPYMVGWLDMDSDTGYWAPDPCPLPEFDTILCHAAMYDAGILARYQTKFVPWPQPSPWLRSLKVHDTLALAYCSGAQDLSLPKMVPHGQRHTVGEDQYLAQDLFVTREYFHKLIAKNEGTAYDIDRALIPALIDTSYRGYDIDHERLEEVIWKQAQRCNNARRRFDSMVESEQILKSRRKKVTKAKGTEYVETFGPPDIGSPTQLGRLFNVDSTDDEHLRRIKAVGGEVGILADLILRYRPAKDILTRYLFKLRGRERLQGLFNITPSEDDEGGTAVGRLSSERENLQNLIKKMKDLLRCLRAPEGYLLLRADYPQAELRWAAERSEDEYLLTALAEGRDVHMETRDYFRKFRPGWCECGPVKCIHRDKAKRFNFGVLYGGGAPYLSSILQVPVAVGQELLEAHKQHWVGYWKWVEEHWAEVQRTGVSISSEPFLHKRQIPLLAEPERAKKIAIAHPPESSAAYMTKVVMAEMFQDGALLVNQIHDAIHTYVPEDCDQEKEKARVRDHMTEVAWRFLPRIGAPLKDEDVEISKYWSE